jgi:hypothetical protein
MRNHVVKCVGREVEQRLRPLARRRWRREARECPRRGRMTSLFERGDARFELLDLRENSLELRAVVLNVRLYLE